MALTVSVREQSAAKEGQSCAHEHQGVREMHVHLASLQRQRCQLHRELQELCHELPAASSVAPELPAGAAVEIAADVFRSPRRRLAPPPPRLAARVAALESLQSELMAACDAFAIEMDAAHVPAGTHHCLISWAGVFH